MPIIAGAKKPLSAPCIADDEVIAYRIDEKHKELIYSCSQNRVSHGLMKC